MAGYGLFESRKLLEGPRITITSPVDGSATSSAVVVVEGEAQNISFLTINDKPAFTDESGHFSETLSPPSGYTVVTVASIDRFGRRASKSVAINVLDYCPV
ncbi:MAG: hypothetical protein Q7S26_00065 [bacterium]|nr:hypothetical protein [bacterium]